jgi:simple sugar transport system permease protein
VDGLLSSAAPLIFASLGALFSELAGVLAIFIEGFMTLGAFFGYVFWLNTGSTLLGGVIVVVLAAAAGWAFRLFVRASGADPFIAGLALNLASGAVTLSCQAAWFGTKGVLRSAALHAPPAVRLSIIEKIPFLGQALSPAQSVCYAALLLAPACAVFVNKTGGGLRLRVSGLSAEAARESGFDPERYRAAAWAAAAAFAALAGWMLTLRIGAYAPGVTAGRGWLALAAVFLGLRRVGGVTLAACVFALAERLVFNLQALAVFPATALFGLPSALALTLYVLVGKRPRAGPAG